MAAAAMGRYALKGVYIACLGLYGRFESHISEIGAEHQGAEARVVVSVGRLSPSCLLHRGDLTAPHVSRRPPGYC
ncbi:hypothetical protein Sm713_32310 [Streptomyces sp. TS71-3]|nr:hypothetical protein Sm713_32310 [Streptomyces sp. TS71-3]